ncbi:MAG: RnfABCDGE type electron transport complex subunit D [Ruminococcaceae bacterium]|nr:RnfABCDGE type electron transport complex subunit D [Oscillospiraceae bacterium]
MNKLNVSISPHIRSGNTTAGIMLDVIIALIPALIASVYHFGFRAFYITAVCVLSCVLGELAFQLIAKRDIAIGDLSAVVTGMLLAFNLPVTIPEWQAIIGSLVAIVVVKELFGGIGFNFANPAGTARIMMLVAFSGTMTNWTEPHHTDLVTTATPLSLIAEGDTDNLPTFFRMIIGDRAGSMGETCAIALVFGFVYLLCRKVITWHTPVVFVVTAFVFTYLATGFDFKSAVYQVLAGGLLLGAIFMATDYATTPPTAWGKVIFGFGCGIITVAVRLWGSNPEGVSFAILFMNILTPYISKLTKHRIFGANKPKKKKA